MSVDQLVLLFFLGFNAIVDIWKKEIILLPAILYGFVALWRVLAVGNGWETVMTGLFPGLFLLALSLVSKGRIGLGDVWILLIMGIQRGFIQTMWILWLAVSMLSICFLILLAVKVKDAPEKMVLPMVPFLFLGTLVCDIFC